MSPAFRFNFCMIYQAPWGWRREAQSMRQGAHLQPTRSACRDHFRWCASAVAFGAVCRPMRCGNTTMRSVGEGIRGSGGCVIGAAYRRRGSDLPPSIRRPVCFLQSTLTRWVTSCLLLSFQPFSRLFPPPHGQLPPAHWLLGVFPTLWCSPVPAPSTDTRADPASARRAAGPARGRVGRAGGPLWCGPSLGAWGLFPAERLPDLSPRSVGCSQFVVTTDHERVCYCAPPACLLHRRPPPKGRASRAARAAE